MKKIRFIAIIVVSIGIIFLGGFILLSHQGLVCRNGIEMARVEKDNHTTMVNIYFARENLRQPNLGNTDSTLYGLFGQVCAHLAERNDGGDSIPAYLLPSLYNSGLKHQWYAKVSVCPKRGAAITPKEILDDLFEMDLVSSDTVFQPSYTIGLGEEYDHNAHGLSLQDVLFVVRRCGMPAAMDPTCNETCPTKVKAKDLYRCRSDSERVEYLKESGVAVFPHEHERMQVVTFVPVSVFKALFL